MNRLSFSHQMNLSEFLWWSCKIALRLWKYYYCSNYTDSFLTASASVVIAIIYFLFIIKLSLEACSAIWLYIQYVLCLQSSTIAYNEWNAVYHFWQFVLYHLKVLVTVDKELIMASSHLTHSPTRRLTTQVNNWTIDEVCACAHACVCVSVCLSVWMAVDRQDKTSVCVIELITSTYISERM